LKIALCDDDDMELQKAKKIIEEFIDQKHPNYQITLHTFMNGDDLLHHINKYEDFDLFILDIIMPNMNGIELATEIRCKNTQSKIIFLTSSPEFAVNSYKVDAFYYLLKPFSEKELNSLLCKVLDIMEQEKSASIVIKEAGKLSRVQIHAIQYIESVKHNIYFHLHSGEVLSCYGTINEFCDILMSDKRFVRCHKSFVINMNYVINISSRDFVMKDKTLIPISRQAYLEVKNSYTDYFFEKGNNRL